MSLRHPSLRLTFALLAILAIAPLGSGPARAAALGHQGLQGGWAIDDSGRVNFLHSVVSELPLMQQAGAGVVRINFRLGACYTSWTGSGCSTADHPTALADYDTVVNTAITTYHLQVVGLLSPESWTDQNQNDWTANSAEVSGGNGDNAYVRTFGTSVAGVIAQHFAGRISTWEVWNEPNSWASNPSPGVYTGNTYVYPSNFAWLLKHAYTAIKSYEPGSASTVLTGGLLGQDSAAASVLVTQLDGTQRSVVKHASSSPNMSAAGASTRCTSTVPSGADYLCNTYRMGQSTGGWRPGAYPLDGVGQHLYIDQGGVTSATKISAFLQDVRTAYVGFEGTKTAKKTEITEFGWIANPSSATFHTDAANQTQNVQTAYAAFRTTTYVSRADYFTAQDVPEGSIFYGLVEGDGTTYKPAFSAYQTAADY